MGRQAKETIVYTYRGPIERGARYEWRDGYSATGAGGGILYPWMTKRECQANARSQGKRAVFEQGRRPKAVR
jgi:hypothetical protein